MEIAHIYQIRNIINNKKYIGSTVSLPRRYYWHKRALKKGQHHSIALQRAWDKYGENSFVFEVIKICSKSERLIEEQNEINRYKFGEEIYNSAKIADKPPTFCGEEHPGSKLNWIQIKEIRKLYNEKGKTQQQLADFYGVKQGIVGMIVNNKLWFDSEYHPQETYKNENKSRGSGEDHHNAKFTNEQVADMREQYKIGKITLEELGKQYNSDKGIIWNIIQNNVYYDPTYNPPSRNEVKKRGKLNWEIIKEIRREFLETNITQQKLADKYEMTRGSMLQILNNQTWIDKEYINTRKRKQNNEN